MRTTMAAFVLAGMLGPVPAAWAQDDAALIAAGKAVFLENCAVCHGEKLEPNPPAADLRKLRASQRDRFNTAVMNGRAPEMPAWQGVITAPQLDQLWAFIQSVPK